MARPIDFLNDEFLEQTIKLSTDCPVWPYLAYYAHKTEEKLKNIDGISQDEKTVVINGFLNNLSSRIVAASNNVLFAEREILEKSSIGHPISVKEHFKLIKETPAYLRNILLAYPELDRLLERVSENFAAQSVRLVENFINDKPILSNSFNLQGGSSIIECEVSEGETHNGSMTVCILTFSNKERLVYKPRNLELESSASKILKTLADKGGANYSDWTIPFYIIGDNHGWTEYVPQKPVEREIDIAKYYQRAGFLLGYCTAFTASDITSDNLIAHGTSPVPIDLETVFYSVLSTENIPKEVRWNSTQTSILPNWTWKGTDGIGVDLSALGGLKEQYVSLNLYQHIEDKDGNDSFGMDGVKIQPGKNVLYFNDKPATPWKYEKEIIEGFECFFRTLNEHRFVITEAIKALSGLTCRYVPRSTATYHYAVQCSLHASLMNSSENRKAFLKKILDNDTAPAIGFLDSEIQACLNLDIPYAQGNVGTLTFIEPCYSGDGYLDSNDYLDGLSHSIGYIENITPARISFEVSLISNTLLAMRYMYDHDKKLTEHKFRENDPLDSFEEQNLNSIFEKIELSQNKNTDFINNQLRNELSINGLWLGFHASPGGYIEYSELGEDFYYGLSGILYGCTSASKWVHIPENLLRSLMEQVYARIHIKLKNKGSHLGGFHFGLSSAITPLYISLSYFADSRKELLLTDYKKYIENILEETWWQKNFWGVDLLSGTCGTLAVITKLYELTNDEAFAALAKSLYSKIETELSSHHGRKIPTFDKSITTRADGLLSGISHGVMGCAYAIFYFNETITKDKSIYSTFMGFLEWELSEFDVNIQNWNDYRKRSKSEKGEFSWSHGLPGNYLALKYFASRNVSEAISFLEKYPAEILFSYENLHIRNRPTNDSLCHGAYGLLNIIKKVCPDILLDHRVYIWTNIPNLTEQDTRELRTRAADPLGLWVGKVGSILGSIGVLNKEYEFPFLAHEMNYIQQ